MWNPTIANLTLMALGSSAPEILLSVIETLMTLGSTPGELGPSTIVGSAAFNLLVISGISIAAVPSGEVKKIDDLGVFAITALASLFAYVWMFICLQLWSKGEIEIAEAILTFLFFIILVVSAYVADRVNACRMKRKRKAEGKEEEVEGIQNNFNLEDFYHIVQLKEKGDTSKEVNEKHE